MEQIRKGTQINTIEGYFVVTGYNGHIVYCDEYTTSEEDLDTFEKAGERRLTLQEIAHEMKKVDGRNHHVTWEE
jgi:hypothetical protein